MSEKLNHNKSKSSWWLSSPDDVALRHQAKTPGGHRGGRHV
jgi:hypothetical protein